MKELTIDATVENVVVVTAFVDEQLEQLDCPIKAQMQVDIAIDELFGNIAHYAYHPKTAFPTTHSRRLTPTLLFPPRSGKSAVWESIW